jgi:hypothetical protein
MFLTLFNEWNQKLLHLVDFVVKNSLKQRVKDLPTALSVSGFEILDGLKLELVV